MKGRIKSRMTKQFGFFNDLLKLISQGKPLPIRTAHLVGSRNSSKSVSSIEFMLKACLLPNVKVRCFLFRNMSDRLADSWRNLKQWAFRMYPTINWNIRETFPSTLKIGKSEIQARSLHTTKTDIIKLTGLPDNGDVDYVIVFCDERYEIDPIDFSNIKDAVRGCPNVIYINACNPWTRLNPYIAQIIKECPQNEELIKRTGEQFVIKKDTIYYYQNWRVNEFITDNDKQHLLEVERLDPVSARVRSFGLVGMESGGIYTHLLPKVSRLLTPCEYYSAGFDYGFMKDEMAALLVGTDKNFEKLNVIETYKWKNDRFHKDHKVLAIDIVDFFTRQASKIWQIRHYGLTVYCDYANYTFIELLNDASIKKGQGNWLIFKECVKLLVELRIGKIQALMASERLNISLQAQDLIEELTLRQWDLKSRKPTPISGNDHLLDSLDYAIVTWLKSLSANLNPYL